MSPKPSVLRILDNDIINTQYVMLYNFYYCANCCCLPKGRYLNDVRKIFGFLDPLPPTLSLSHSRYLSVLSSRFDQPPSLPLSADVI